MLKVLFTILQWVSNPSLTKVWVHTPEFLNLIIFDVIGNGYSSLWFFFSAISHLHWEPSNIAWLKERSLRICSCSSVVKHDLTGVRSFWYPPQEGRRERWGKEGRKEGRNLKDNSSRNCRVTLQLAQPGEPGGLLCPNLCPWGAMSRGFSRLCQNRSPNSACFGKRDNKVPWWPGEFVAWMCLVYFEAVNPIPSEHDWIWSQGL
jgi:hypothetical protein